MPFTCFPTVLCLSGGSVVCPWLWFVSFTKKPGDLSIISKCQLCISRWGWWLSFLALRQLLHLAPLTGSSVYASLESPGDETDGLTELPSQGLKLEFSEATCLGEWGSPMVVTPLLGAIWVVCEWQWPLPVQAPGLHVRPDILYNTLGCSLSGL